MEIFIVDPDQNKVVAIEYGDVADLSQFERELDVIHDEWYYDIADAQECLSEDQSVTLPKKFAGVRHYIKG